MINLIFFTLLTVNIFILFTLYIYFLSLIKFEIIIETFEPESYIPNVSNESLNSSFILINGVIICFF
jgi:hypothetical protein